MMSLGAGTKLGRYEIRSKIGEGGMGEVYLAADTSLHRKVALKVLPVDVGSNQDRMRRFKQEATAAAALNHPNIAHIYEIGDSDGRNFIAMEFVDGKTLRESIHRDHVDLKKLLRYLQQVAEGLAKAHAAGIVHRDLKPDNIMIARDGYAKILDFGLAKLVEPQGVNRDGLSEVATALMQQHSLPGTVMGTVGYMSPEQAQGKVNEIDHRSDIFAFGCMLFEAATGHKAFAGKDNLDSLHNIVHAPTPQISELNPLAPAELQRIVRRCLAKDPDKRYQSIKEVAIELDEVRQELKEQSDLHDSVHQTAPAPTSSGQTAVSGSAPSTGVPADSLLTRQSSAEYIVEGVKRNKKIVLAALALIVLAGAAFAIYRYVVKPKPSHFERVKMTRITTEGNLQNVVVAPDGKYIAYTLLTEGKYSLWTKHLATGSRVQIVPPSTSSTTVQFFSHDGGYVYYSQRDEEHPQGALFQVAVLGSASKKILSNVQSTTGLSPDGKQLAFGRYHPGTSEQYELLLANADGTNERRLKTFSEPDFFEGNSVSWSPDGKLLALDYGGTDAVGEFMTVLIVSAADGTSKKITSHRWFDVGRIGWFSDGSGLVLTAVESVTDEMQIWQVSYPGGEVRRITNDLNTYGSFSMTLTSDSRLLVALQNETSTNTWIAPDGDAQRARAVTELRKNVRDFHCEWTPDGRIVFSSNVGGGNRIWLMNADGTGQKPLTEAGDDAKGAQISPDGRYIYFTSIRSKVRQVWRMDIDGSNQKQLTELKTLAYFSLTPDGKWVLYNLYTPGLWKMPAEGGTPIKISDAIGDGLEVSPDGNLLAYEIVDQQSKRSRMIVVRWDDLAPHKTFDLPVTARAWHWSPDSKAIIYDDRQGTVSNLWRLPLDGGRPAQMTDFKSLFIDSFSYSRDGRQLALARGSTTRDAVLITDEK